MPFADVFEDVSIIPEEELSPPSLKVMAALAVSNSDVAVKAAGNIPNSVKWLVISIKEDMSKDTCMYPEQFVTWERCTRREIMYLQELEETLTEEAALDLDYESLEEFYAANVEETGHEPSDNSIAAPRPGIKLGGYVRWAQGIEYPTCPDCHILMDTTFLQIEQDPVLLDNIWGDCGTAHVTLCSNCKRPAFGWACC